MLARLYPDTYACTSKSDDELTVEAWIWDQVGDHGIAARLRAARNGV